VADRRLILDSGALSALAAGDERTLAWLYRSIEEQMSLGIPAPVVAETFTGGASDARLHRVISSPSFILDTTYDIGRAAARVRFRSKQPDKTIDAIVIATAAQFPRSIVLTSDPDDLRLLSSQCPEALLAVRSVNVLPKRKSRRDVRGSRLPSRAKLSS
jgi:predicted nucleic acid-binding protein